MAGSGVIERLGALSTGVGRAIGFFTSGGTQRVEAESSPRAGSIATGEKCSGKNTVHSEKCIHRDIYVNLMKGKRIKAQALAIVLGVVSSALAQVATQRIEGFAEVDFHHNANRGTASRDFRGMAQGYITAGWWAEGQMTRNLGCGRALRGEKSVRYTPL